MTTLRLRPMDANAFAPFGDVIDASGASFAINQGLCQRHNDLSRPEVLDGAVGISLFQAEPRALPYDLEMMERHPLGSQAFLPGAPKPFLVVVAPDEGGVPGQPLAFLTEPGQGVSYHRGTWHGVLTPLDGPGAFFVVDRIGSGTNLEEHWFETPYLIKR